MTYNPKEIFYINTEDLTPEERLERIVQILTEGVLHLAEKEALPQITADGNKSHN